MKAPPRLKARARARARARRFRVGEGSCFKVYERKIARKFELCLVSEAGSGSRIGLGSVVRIKVVVHILNRLRSLGGGTLGACA